MKKIDTQVTKPVSKVSSVAQNRLEQFSEILGKPDKEDSKVAIFIGAPDPDSMGAGAGMQVLVRLITGESAVIIYEGEVDHKQNTHAINTMDISMVSLSESTNGENDPLWPKYRRVIFVDCFPRAENGLKDCPDPIVFDHHDVEDDAWAYSDVRQVGSVCSIIWEYLNSSGYNFSNDNEHGVEVATVLDFGIQNDSKGLTSENTSDLDIMAHSSLLPFIDRVKLASVMRYKKPIYHIDFLRATMDEGNHIMKGNFYVGFAGMLSTKQKGEIPDLADFWVEMQGIETSVVYGIVSNSKLAVSVRSFNPQINVDTFVKTVFGAGGGKKGAGAALVDMGPFSITTDSKELQADALDAVKKLIMDKVVKYLSDA